MGEVLQKAVDRLIAQGKITYVGSSNWPGWKIAQANEQAKANHRLGLVSEQSLYNLVERRVELEVIPAALEYGLGVIAWSPLAGGLLASGVGEADGRRQSDAVKVARAALSHQLAGFEQLCAEFGESQSAIALAWTLHQNGITASIVGPSSCEQLANIVHVPELFLCEEVLAKIDTIFPPYGPAPEAYAW